jgi:hypothetical protein
MKIKLDWFKKSGKWYEGYEVDIPEDVYLFSKDLGKYLQLNKHCHSDMYLVLDYDEDKSDNFFKALYTPERVQELRENA